MSLLMRDMGERGEGDDRGGGGGGGERDGKAGRMERSVGCKRGGSGYLMSFIVRSSSATKRLKRAPYSSSLVSSMWVTCFSTLCMARRWKAEIL